MSDNIDRLSQDVPQPPKKEVDVLPEGTEKIKRDKVIVDPIDPSKRQIVADINDLDIKNRSFESDVIKTNAEIMLENSKRQIKAREEGIALGLRHQELKKYIQEQTADISIRPELSETANKKIVEVIYNNEEIENTPKREISREEVLAQIEADRLELDDEEIEKELSENEEYIKNKKLLDNIEQKLDKVIDLMARKDFDSEYDFVKVPSLCKQYETNKKELKVSFLNGSDEDILTNPNILKSGRYVEVLMRRKLLEKNIDYNDLLEQDVTAILFWLRVTAYGEMYNVTIQKKDSDKTEEPIELTVDLSKLPVKYLELEPNERGLFDFKTEKNHFEFKFLTVGDKLELEKNILDKLERDELIYELTADTLSMVVKRLNGITDRNEIRNMLNKMRIIELKKFKDYLTKHSEFGLQTNVTIQDENGVKSEVPFPFEPHFFGIE